MLRLILHGGRKASKMFIYSNNNGNNNGVDGSDDHHNPIQLLQYNHQFILTPSRYSCGSLVHPSIHSFFSE